MDNPPSNIIPVRGAPRSLFDEDRRYLTQQECDEVFERVLALTQGGGDTSVSITGRWAGNLRWARNRIISSGDTRDVRIRIIRSIRGAMGEAYANAMDDGALRLAIRSAERYVLLNEENPDAPPMPGAQRYLAPPLWSDGTYALDATALSKAGFDLVQPATAANMLAAGYGEVRADTRSIYNTAGMRAYYAATGAEYSVTVRDPEERGSGWAGRTHYDWHQLHADALTASALEKCMTSMDPRMVEPGRYNVILEPQAVHDLMQHMVRSMDRMWAEQSTTAFSLSPGQSLIGKTMFDPRISIETDPADPECGFMPFDSEGLPYRKVRWVEDGVLKELAYNRWYAMTYMDSDEAMLNPGAYRMSGGSTSLAEMIASTWRGLLVTRLHDVNIIDGPSLQCTGTTRDGLWLIENGRVTHPVQNMRFNESPLFVLNNLDEVGVPERVYGNPPAVVPPLKVRDFSFNGLTSAV